MLQSQLAGFHVLIECGHERELGDVPTGSFSFENRDPTDTERDLMQQMEDENTR